MREIIKLGTVLMLFNLIAGALLSFAYIKTAPIIEANKLAASGDNVRAEVLVGMNGGFESRGEGSEFPYWIGYTDSGMKNPGGYVFITYEKGYSSTIETMIGINIDGNITGVKILFQQETPGLGDKIEKIKAGEDDPWFPRQFIGKSASFNFNVSKDGGGIDAITGATISSRAVAVSIINGINNLLTATGGDAFSQKIETAEITPEADEISLESLEDLLTEEIMEEVLPGMDGGCELTGEDDVIYWTGYMDMAKMEPGGYIFVALGKGYVSTIVTAVGVDPDGTIVGIKILSHEETPGYAEKLDEIREGESLPWFPGQFIGKSVSDIIALTGKDGDIDPMSEAIESSQAITVSIDRGLKELMEIVEDM